jgi:hypothetical protein
MDFLCMERTPRCLRYTCSSILDCFAFLIGYQNYPRRGGQINYDAGSPVKLVWCEGVSQISPMFVQSTVPRVFICQLLVITRLIAMYEHVLKYLGRIDGISPD